jgi:hypothetical protein
MKNKTWMVWGVILCGICLQNEVCPFPSVFDYTFIVKGDILNQYTDVFSLTPDPSVVVTVEPGTYAFYGSVDFWGDGRLGASDSSDRGKYPPSLYLKLVKSISVAPPPSPTFIDTDAIEIKLTVNPKTGEIPSQNITIVNQLTADPAKNESIKFQMRTGKGKIPGGKTIQIGYTKVGA